jgi:hypothetical protein
VASEVDGRGEVGAVGEDGGDEGAVEDPVAGGVDGDGSDAGDLAGLAGEGVAAYEGLVVDPQDDLGDRAARPTPALGLRLVRLRRVPAAVTIVVGRVVGEGSFEAVEGNASSRSRNRTTSPIFRNGRRCSVCHARTVRSVTARYSATSATVHSRSGGIALAFEQSVQLDRAHAPLPVELHRRQLALGDPATNGLRRHGEQLGHLVG